MEDRLSRRSVVQAGAGVAVGLALGRFRAAEAAESLQRFEPPRPLDLRQRLLLRGGTIISMDPKVGDFAKGDVLIEGKTIRAVGANLSASGATVIDASNMILIPGLIDCHRHSWEGQLRRINPNAPTLADYSNATHLSFATHYRPQDMYAGGMITALGCIDAGITCVIDNSHNARSAAHSDAAIEALMDLGCARSTLRARPKRANGTGNGPKTSRVCRRNIFRVPISW